MWELPELDSSIAEDLAPFVGEGDDLVEHKLCSICKDFVVAYQNEDIVTEPCDYEIRSDRPYGIGYHKVIHHAFLGHHEDPKTLRRSALNGCHLCSLLDFSQQNPRDFDDEIPSISYELRITEEGANCICVKRTLPTETRIFEIYITQDGKKGPYEGYKLHPTSTAADDFKPPPPNPSDESTTYRSTASSAVFSLVKSWLEKCQKTHARCSEIKIPRTLPARLLELDDADGNTSARLIDTQTQSENVEYVVLSHVWKKASILRLQVETLHQFKNQMPIHKLPQTFRDAIDITSRLGFKYLWIDALCIIQDSISDVNKEIRVMGNVYKNSICHVAALGADNSNGGCYFKRNPLTLRTCKVPHDKPSKELQFSRKGFSFLECNWEEMGLPPLLARAWVFQERLLAPRTIFYGKDMVAWECLECSVNENRPSMQADQFQYLQRVESVKSHLSRMGYFFNEGEAHGAWWIQVRAYSKLALTNGGDRWKAFYGCARLFETGFSIQLPFGLGKGRLLVDMEWYSLMRAERRIKGLPTWSWTSVDGKIDHAMVSYEHHYKGRFQSKSELIELDLKDGDSGEYNLFPGEGPMPSVTIRGRLCPFKRGPWMGDENGGAMGIVFDHVEHTGKCLPDVKDELKPIKTRQEFETAEPAYALRLHQIVDFDEVRDQEGNKQEGWNSDVGIVILPIEPEEDQPKLWRRVGYFMQHAPDDVATFLPEHETIVTIV